MNATEIKKYCYHYGYRKLVQVVGVPLSVDFCGNTHVECSKVTKCDPSIRIPKVREVHRSKKVSV